VEDRTDKITTTSQAWLREVMRRLLAAAAVTALAVTLTALGLSAAAATHLPPMLAAACPVCGDTDGNLGDDDDGRLCGDCDDEVFANGVTWAWPGGAR
jgi:hypothetical protein